MNQAKATSALSQLPVVVEDTTVDVGRAADGSPAVLITVAGVPMALTPDEADWLSIRLVNVAKLVRRK